MKKFAELLDALALTPQRNAKLRLLTGYFAATPDPDRGYALAAITGDLKVRSVKPAMIRQLAYARVDPALFDLSYDYVGDLAETVGLIWPAKPGANRTPPLSEIVETLSDATRAEGLAHIETWLDALDSTGRWALLKLATGGMRIGVSSRLAKQALASFGDKDIVEIEELGHALAPPYAELFAWLEGRGEKPEATMRAPFRPVMLAHPLEAADLAALDPKDFALEWKWDGIRVQAVADRGARRLYSRTGDDIGKAFPDIIETLSFDATIDGELLVFDPSVDGFHTLPFGELQKRLNRKTVDRKLLTSRPAFIRAYDLLEESGEDLRRLAFEERRARLEQFIERKKPLRMDISALLEPSSAVEIADLRSDPPHNAIEGVMLKRKSAPYVPGRPKGEWWKWKRDPRLIDAVLLYAQRGHGKRSSYYSDYTFGVWSDDGLVPVGKAYFGFTDEELKQIDKFVRDNTIDRFGPVRQVKANAESGLVFEVAFEGLNRSTRHKSGVAMRFPRINRIRWDKPAAEADRIETLEAMLDAS